MSPNMTGLNQTGLGFCFEDACSTGFFFFFAEGGTTAEASREESFRDLATYVSYRIPRIHR